MQTHKQCCANRIICTLQKVVGWTIATIRSSSQQSLGPPPPSLASIEGKHTKKNTAEHFLFIARPANYLRHRHQLVSNVSTNSLFFLLLLKFIFALCSTVWWMLDCVLNARLCYGCLFFTLNQFMMNGLQVELRESTQCDSSFFFMLFQVEEDRRFRLMSAVFPAKKNIMLALFRFECQAHNFNLYKKSPENDSLGMGHLECLLLFFPLLHLSSMSSAWKRASSAQQRSAIYMTYDPFRRHV